MIFRKMANSLEINIPSWATPINILAETDEHWITSLPVEQKEEETTTCHPHHLKEKIAQLQDNHKAVISLLLGDQDIDRLFGNHAKVEVATDGGFNPTSGISSYGWIMAVNKTLVAKGRGPVAAHPELAESFRAEGFGIDAALIFLQLLTSHLNIEKEQHSWKFYLESRNDPTHGELRA
jgi:hypothetical protein